MKARVNYDPTSVSVFEPIDAEAKAWVEERVSSEGFHPAWPTLYVDRNYIGDLMAGFEIEGGEVEVA